MKHSADGLYIYFWGNQDWASNWYQHEFQLEGFTCHCSEQGMMYLKAKLMGDTAIMDKLSNMPNYDPAYCKKLGREITPWNEALWVKHRLEIMQEVLYLKFSDARLKKLLLDTGKKTMVEASPYDKIWGVGLGMQDPLIANPKHWKGLNLLGVALMNVRDSLNQPGHQPNLF